MLTFKYYCMEVMDGVVNQGYYVILTVMDKCPSEQVVDEDDN